MSTPWLNKVEYPFASRLLDLEGIQMHYVDEGQGEVILFVHGTPSWSFDFRHIIKRLRGSYRCIAFDHIGFGLSDKPGDYNYTTRQHAENLQHLIIALNLQEFTLVVHDFGGPIGFHYALKHPDQIKQLIIFNTWLWSLKHDSGYKKFSKALRSPLLPFLYKYLNFSARFLLPRSFVNKRALTKEIRKHYVKPFGKPSERLGTVGFAKSLLIDQDWFESLWQQKEAVIDKRTLFIWGMADKFIGADYLEKFEKIFNNSSSVRLKDTGHFPQEEQAVSVASYIANWLRE